MSNSMTTSTNPLPEVTIFKGADDAVLLKRVEDFRLMVWCELIDADLARRRFGLDAFDEKAWHVIYLDQNKIIACGRLVVASQREEVPDQCSFKPYLDTMRYPIGLFNRLVVDPGCQGQGLGAAINRHRIQLATDRDISNLWVEVQSNRVASMKRLGFAEMGISCDKSVEGDWRIMRRCS